VELRTGWGRHGKWLKKNGWFLSCTKILWYKSTSRITRFKWSWAGFSTKCGDFFLFSSFFFFMIAIWVELWGEWWVITGKRFINTTRLLSISFLCYNMEEWVFFLRDDQKWEKEVVGLFKVEFPVEVISSRRGKRGRGLKRDGCGWWDGYYWLYSEFQASTNKGWKIWDLNKKTTK